MTASPFLLLAGAEPDYQWERMVEAVMELNKALGVDLTVSVHGIPMAVPHTRPLGDHRPRHRPASHHPDEPAFGTVQVPASWSALLELRLGESGHDASASPSTCRTTSHRPSSPTPRSPASGAVQRRHRPRA